MVTNLTFPYNIDQTKYSEMNNIFRIVRTELCHQKLHHIIRFLVYRSPGMSMYLKRFCSNLFSCISVIKIIQISHARF